MMDLDTKSVPLIMYCFGKKMRRHRN